MAGELTKRAILDLEINGAPAAEVRMRAIGMALLAAERATRALGPAAIGATDALARTGRIGEAAFAAVRSGADRATAAVKALSQVVVQGRFAQSSGQLEALRRAAQRVQLGGIAPATGLGYNAMKLRAMGGVQGAPAGPGLASGAVGAVGALRAVLPHAAAAAAAIYGVKRAGDALFETLASGEKAKAIESSFARVAQQTGGAAATMGALERATGGGVAKTELMTAANRLLVADLGISRERLEQIANATVILAKAQGLTATDGIQRMSLALAKQEPELIDELGIKVDLTKAIHDYAAAKKVEVGSVDAATRSRIFLDEVEKQAIARSGQLRGSIGPLASATERMTKRWEDFTTRYAKFVADQPGFAKALEATAEAAMKIGEALRPLIELAGKVAAALTPVIELYGKAQAASLASPLVGGAGAGPTGVPVVALAAAAQLFTGGGKGGAGGAGAGGAGAQLPGRGGPEVVELGPRTIEALAKALGGRRPSPSDLPQANRFGG